MGSAQRHTRGRARGEGGSLGWVGQPAAIYCRISRARDEDQTGVDRQERLCREVAERLGLVIAPGGVFVDNNRSAWQRNRNRPGWNAFDSAMGVASPAQEEPREPMRGANVVRLPPTDYDSARVVSLVRGSPFDTVRSGQTYGPCLGVKGSQVQILSSRQS
jgi:hypothetical protein